MLKLPLESKPTFPRQSNGQRIHYQKESEEQVKWTIYKLIIVCQLILGCFYRIFTFQRVTSENSSLCVSSGKTKILFEMKSFVNKQL